MSDRTCSIEGCGKKARKRGWCSMHYERWRRHGDVNHEGERQPPVCIVDGCDKPTRARGWCVAHYSRWENWGTVAPDVPLRGPRGGCLVEGCPEPHHAKGYCAMHHGRIRRRGDPDWDRSASRRPIADRFWVKVAANGDCWEWTGCRTSAGYGLIATVRGQRPEYAHRLSWTMMRGEIPAGLELDHLCRNRACVNPYHLEPVPGAVNTQRAQAVKRAIKQGEPCPTWL